MRLHDRASINPDEARAERHERRRPEWYDGNGWRRPKLYDGHDWGRPEWDDGYDWRMWPKQYDGNDWRNVTFHTLSS